ncbi:ferritin family protein [Archangium lansingense]|uniref:Ferritin n=1 Tax=Archangium lansingense TaxID=2995310 RepID=A0ABT4AAA0_9BACT|nr:ferritin [Archangium lansinium]MCY1078582.1 ferritin [Archangium lansinium]
MAAPPEKDLSTDVALVRQVLARELETINEYEAHARVASTPELRDFFLHLAAEEKEHVAEAVHMLRMLDAGQEAHFAKPVTTGHFQGAIEGKPSPAPAPAPAAAAPSPAAPSEPAPRGPARGGRNANGQAEPPPGLVQPERILYGVPAPPPSPGAQPLTVGSLRRSR